MTLLQTLFHVFALFYAQAFAGQVFAPRGTLPKKSRLKTYRRFSAILETCENPFMSIDMAPGRWGRWRGFLNPRPGVFWTGLTAELDRMDRIYRMEDRVGRKDEAAPVGEGCLTGKSILFILLILSQLLPVVISTGLVPAKPAKRAEGACVSR
jgi:hypothetical protein